MAKGPSEFAHAWRMQGKETLVNAGELPPDGLWLAERRVLRMQARLHQWAADDPGRRFGDLLNLVYHPDFLRVAWDRVRGNKGARTAGVDRVIPAFISGDADVAAFLENVREQVKTGAFTPLPVRERMIPKAGQPGRFRRLGIPAAADRLVQASLKLVLEPIFEADFKPVSYGFRPRRRAHDAVAEIQYLASGSRKYHWVLEADIEACFDELSHSAILARVRRRIGDKRVVALVRSFLKAGIMSEAGKVRTSVTGTPQGGILSPLLANVALSALDEHFRAKWDAHGSGWRRRAHRARGGATCRIVRYADDFVIMVFGSRAHAEELREEVSAVLAPLGLRLSEAKTRVCHVDEGFDFLGYRIQRRTKRGTSRKYVYTYPSRKALASITAKVRAVTNGARHRMLADLLRELNAALRGWCNYFRHGVSAATFSYLDSFTWRRVTLWLRKRHKGITWKALYRQFLTGPGRTPREGATTLFRAQGVETACYRWRGHSIPGPWTSISTTPA
jgi:RNA-directed DNA polymerase